MVAFSWFQGRVGDRPWSSLSNMMTDTQYHFLDERDLEDGGAFLIRIISDSIHHTNEKFYGPYDLGLNVREEHDRVIKELMSETKAKLERSDWLKNSWRWDIDHTFATEYGPIVRSIAFGTDPGSLDTVLQIPIETNPISKRSVPVGESVDSSELNRLFEANVRRVYEDVERLYTQFTYIDGTKSPVRAFPG